LLALNAVAQFGYLITGYGMEALIAYGILYTSKGQGALR